MSNDGTRTVVGRYDGTMDGRYNGTIRLWDSETGSPVGEALRGHDRGV